MGADRCASRCSGNRKIRTGVAGATVRRMSQVDARLEELQFLAEIERNASPFQMHSVPEPTRQMILSLLIDGYLNDGFVRLSREVSKGYVADPLDELRRARNQDLKPAFIGEEVILRISHKGRVRLSELRQQLRTGRDRDETGLLWSKRHLMTDLAIAVLSAGGASPLSVAFLDMNGLGAINNVHGHEAGDDAIRAFFQAVLMTIGQQGDAYRNGGDEVVLILPNVSDETARKLLDVFVKQLGKDALALGDAKVRTYLTASCGSMSTTDPRADATHLRKLADDVQYRAKEESKKPNPRVSAFAVGDGAVVTYAPNEPERV